jgi:hypothetical protein
MAAVRSQLQLTIALKIRKVARKWKDFAGRRKDKTQRELLNYFSNSIFQNYKYGCCREFNRELILAGCALRYRTEPGT